MMHRRSRWILGILLVSAIVVAVLEIAGSKREEVHAEISAVSSSKETDAHQTVATVPTNQSRGSFPTSQQIDDMKKALERKEKRRLLEEFLEETGYTEEEWRELDGIMKASAPYFWDKAEITLGKMLSEEEKNIEWTTRVTDQTLRLIEERGIEHTRLKDVDCGQTICRISFVHKDLESKRAYYDGPLEEIEWNNQASNAYGDQTTLEDGSVESFMYFSKNDKGAAFWELRRRIVKDVESQSDEIES